MFLLGHLGIGERMGRPFSAAGARTALFVGTVLPDLLDKPLYYALSIATGKHASELGLISGTRTIGHTLLFAVGCYAICRFAAGAVQSRALFIGMLTHLLLDTAGELYARVGALFSQAPAGPAAPNIFSAIFFPLLGPHFPVAPFHSVAEHFSTLKSGYVLCGELVGAVLLVLDWRDWKRSKSQKNDIGEA